MNRAEIERMIGEALEYDPSYGVEDVLAEVTERRAELWLGEESIAVTNIIDKPKVRQFHIWIAAGNLVELMDEVYPQIEARAREFGCTVITISGRRGWIRALKKEGFGEVATVGVKELT
jgi:hypothetical protein